ncbi:MAG: ribonuclease-3 [Cellvibrionaceae bacterium]
MLKFQQLQTRLNYEFQDPSLLEMALTHCSFSTKNNERLEFLGDALLSATVAQALFEQFPEEKEGVLSRLRSHLVRGDTLADIGREFALSDYLIMGEGELKSGGFRRDSILADTVEAMIGAIFLDSGMKACQNFIKETFAPRLQNLTVDKNLKDPKTRLQEILQARQLPLPVYDIVDTQGESHDQLFTVCCETALLSKSPRATASSRRQAEKLAAEHVLKQIES